MAEEYENLSGAEITEHLQKGNFLMVNRCKRNGLILYKPHHTEFAGPGAAVGGRCDLDCQSVIPVGNISLIVPDNFEERQTAYKIRIQWVRLMKKSTEYDDPLQRAEKLMFQFENFFDSQTLEQLPDEAFASLVGVLPQTIKEIRYRED
ncbi:hypothetical protein ACE1B6_03980 [Aerosakkonemataceae cyanobacterium BLCC-F154]|uniref:Uncharacterized protein n=1 Tax=Floridaenema fluviatile BLCC-F154 TaxID=3153640 RepID=A0ABV4Y6I1_9CYAN